MSPGRRDDPLESPDRPTQPPPDAPPEAPPRREPFEDMLQLERLPVPAPDGARVRLRAGEAHTNALGLVHGAVLFALADAALSYEAYRTGAAPVSTSVHLSFLRPARAGAELHAAATAQFVGGRRAVYALRVWEAAGTASDPEGAPDPPDVATGIGEVALQVSRADNRAGN